MARGNRFSEEGYRCEDRSVAKFLDGELDRVVAVLGAQSSSVTIQVGLSSDEMRSFARSTTVVVLRRSTRV